MKALQGAGALALALFTGSPLAADPNLGRNLAATCANCHGTNGQAIAGLEIQALAGMEKGQLLQALSDFKAGSRPATIMHQIARGYSDEQLDLIAAYFAAQR